MPNLAAALVVRGPFMAAFGLMFGIKCFLDKAIFTATATAKYWNSLDLDMNLRAYIVTNKLRLVLAGSNNENPMIDLQALSHPLSDLTLPLASPETIMQSLRQPLQTIVTGPATSIKGCSMASARSLFSPSIVIPPKSCSTLSPNSWRSGHVSINPSRKRRGSSSIQD
ncbi:hypothetical protein AC579_8253 [Pseudocercospora musae]|uniref:Uncharacterized protein n=1 Tax=Pseudocercospora musae TaxID=113226 RepID=A0A139IVW6_9PEZI|nr:hypothetical protein AC579_8253 [Pseudocercospora musae]